MLEIDRWESGLIDLLGGICHSCGEVLQDCLEHGVVDEGCVFALVEGTGFAPGSSVSHLEIIPGSSRRKYPILKLQNSA